MDMKRYEEKFDYVSALFPKEPKHPFHQKLIWLFSNDKFLNEIRLIRKKLKKDDHDLPDMPPLKSGDLQAKIIFENSALLPHIDHLWKKCSLFGANRGKYKYPLLEAIISFISYGHISLSLAKLFIDEGKKIPPSVTLRLITLASQIELKFIFNETTELKDVVKELNRIWPKVKKIQNRVRNKRLSPTRNLIRDYYRFYIPYKQGNTPKEILDSLPNETSDKDLLQPNSILKAIQRVQLKIDNSFK